MISLQEGSVLILNKCTKLSLFTVFRTQTATFRLHSNLSRGTMQPATAISKHGTGTQINQGIHICAEMQCIMENPVWVIFTGSLCVVGAHKNINFVMIYLMQYALWSTPFFCHAVPCKMCARKRSKGTSTPKTHHNAENCTQFHNAKCEASLTVICNITYIFFVDWQTWFLVIN